MYDDDDQEIQRLLGVQSKRLDADKLESTVETDTNSTNTIRNGNADRSLFEIRTASRSKGDRRPTNVSLRSLVAQPAQIDSFQEH